MTLFAIRIFNFTILPVLTAAIIAALDPEISNKVRRLEVYLIYMFGLGVAGSGIGGFVGHLFFSDDVAGSIGWPIGNPFQLEMGFANLALGVLGILAIAKRDGFREATVIAVTVIGVGATIVHILDIIHTGNLAPGNTLQNISNLLKPTLLIIFLLEKKKTGKGEGDLGSWHKYHAEAVGFMTASVSMGFGMGFAIENPVFGSFSGVIIGSGLVFVHIKRSRQ
jgi:hypothetical protein